MTFGKILEYHMHEQGFTYTELSKRAGISRRALYYYISDKRLPSVKNLVKICYAMGISLAVFDGCRFKEG